MDKLKDDYTEDKSVVQYLIDITLLPLRIAASPILLRTYLRAVLLFLTSTILFGVAVVAYSSFYYSYIPVRGISVPVYLQYDHDVSVPYIAKQIPETRTSKWPFGIANVPGLVDRQKYDVMISMVVPRSETNLRAGNWMIGLEMRGPTTLGGGVMSLLGWDEEWSVEDHSQGGVAGATTEKGTADTAEVGRATVLARSRRPALLTYRSYAVEHVYRLLRLPLYLVGWHTESEHIEISMMESVLFEQGYKNIPSSLRVEIRSKYPLEVYRVSVQISARLEGLRWLMFRYFISSGIFGIGIFWSVEMGVLLCTWALFTFLFSSSSSSSSSGNTSNTKNIKTEHESDTAAIKSEPATPSLSDTNRTFPTLPSQQPLSYTSPKEEEEEPSTPNLQDIPTREDAEADDEEDDDFVLQEPLPRHAEREGIFTDSGIGTSLESGVERGSRVARRRSGRGRDGGAGG